MTNFFLRYGSIMIVSGVALVFLFNAAFMWKHSSLVKSYMGGLHVSMFQNNLMMNYKKFGLDTSRVDVLLHAVSHYALVHKAVDVGNYQARIDLFPVQFKNALPPVPPRELIELSPWEINWSSYPDIEYLVVWDLKQEEKHSIKKFFSPTFEKDNLSIWQRNQNEASSSPVQF